MCGFVGYLRIDARGDSPTRSEVLRARDRMLLRGPNGAGLWEDEAGGVCLGHRRLSIIDLTAEADQPMLGPHGSHVLVYNGEIYNYRQLRSALIARGHTFRTHSDTEVILRLYEEYGDRCVDHLTGMFAFALWDSVRRELLLARDPYGIKPLYVARTANAVVFASQVKALLEFACVDTSPDPAGHVGFFLWGAVPEPHSLHRGIRSVAPGTVETYPVSGERAARAFWSMAGVVRGATEGPACANRETAREAVGDALTRSVARHYVADVPVGLFLSSGLDSGTLLALASEQGMDLQTITLRFGEYVGTERDEAPLAEALATRYGAKHRTILVRRSQFLDHLDALLSSMDQPSVDGVNSYLISQAAKEVGFKAAISGAGGDELFGGYPSFRQVPRLARLLAVTRSVPSAGRAARRVLASLLPARVSPKVASLLEYGGTWGGAYFLRRCLFLPWELPALLGPEFVAEGLASLDSVENLASTVAGVDDAHLKVLLLESQWYLRHQLLRDADWAGMAHSVEIRLPLVDAQLLADVAGYLSGPDGFRKADLARSARYSLPEAVIQRPKSGFTTPVGEWLRSEGLAKEGDRGLRGWARYVYTRTTGTVLCA